MYTDYIILVFAELETSHLLPDLQRTFDTKFPLKSINSTKTKINSCLLVAVR